VSKQIWIVCSYRAGDGPKPIRAYDTQQAAQQYAELLSAYGSSRPSDPADAIAWEGAAPEGFAVGEEDYYAEQISLYP
jgi:hypothetical protein